MIKNKKMIIYSINFNKKRKIIAFFMCVAVIIAFFMMYLHFIVSPVIIRSSEAHMKILANKSMDYAITEAMSSFVSYHDIIKISRDENGNINSMTANTSKVNNISRMITQIALAKLVELGNDPIRINIGAFTGINAFAGLGPKVSLNVYPYPDITCKFLSTFDDAGINQTQHKIYAMVSTVVRVVFPRGTISVTSGSDVLICEGIIIGEIPDTYLNSNTLTEMLNLVP